MKTGHAQYVADLEAVVAADELDAEYVLVVVELLEPLGAGCRRQAGLDVDLAEAADLELVPAHDAAADERLVPLRLVEAPHQLPHLRSIAATVSTNHDSRSAGSGIRTLPFGGDDASNRIDRGRAHRESNGELQIREEQQQMMEPIANHPPPPRPREGK